jgi:hypothetical protein
MTNHSQTDNQDVTDLLNHVPSQVRDFFQAEHNGIALVESIDCVDDSVSIDYGVRFRTFDVDFSDEVPAGVHATLSQFLDGKHGGFELIGFLRERATTSHAGASKGTNKELSVEFSLLSTNPDNLCGLEFDYAEDAYFPVGNRVRVRLLTMQNEPSDIASAQDAIREMLELAICHSTAEAAESDVIFRMADLPEHLVEKSFAILKESFGDFSSVIEESQELALPDRDDEDYPNEFSAKMGAYMPVASIRENVRELFYQMAHGFADEDEELEKAIASDSTFSPVNQLVNAFSGLQWHRADVADQDRVLVIMSDMLDQMPRVARELVIREVGETFGAVLSEWRGLNSAFDVVLEKNTEHLALPALYFIHNYSDLCTDCRAVFLIASYIANTARQGYEDWETLFEDNNLLVDVDTLMNAIDSIIEPVTEIEEGFDSEQKRASTDLQEALEILARISGVDGSTTAEATVH